MTFPVTEHTVKTARHTTGYLACGAKDAPLLIFCHGWPELALSWRHQLPTMAALGFRCIAPDMRGYGRSSTYTRHEDFAQEPIVEDMLELLASLGSFDKARSDFESNIRNVVKAMFRKGDPARVGKPAATAAVRKAGGWFGGGACPDVPRDPDVITEQDLEAYTAALERNGFFGPNSWYMNHKANGEFARRSKSPRLAMPVLFLHAAYDTTCETVQSRLAEPMRRDCMDLSEVVVKSGHWMAQEQPAAVNAALARWLAAKLATYWSEA